ncbi:MAG: hypothetical protein ACRENE_13845, partial [Polyangiaceae bacterium]
MLRIAVAPELPLDPELERPFVPESAVEADPVEPESVDVPALDMASPPGLPELDPPPVLEPPELDALPEVAAAASISGKRSFVELLPQALAIAARSARHPVRAEWRRTLLLTLAVFICVHAPADYPRSGT